MTINPTLFYIIIGILVALLVISSYIIRNLLVKTEQYEDVTDDEVGEFFNQMKEVQEQLNDYMLPQNYGKETSES